jgi:hypothetical protein
MECKGPSRRQHFHNLFKSKNPSLGGVRPESHFRADRVLQRPFRLTRGIYVRTYTLSQTVTLFCTTCLLSGSSRVLALCLAPSSCKLCSRGRATARITTLFFGTDDNQSITTCVVGVLLMLPRRTVDREVCRRRRDQHQGPEDAREAFSDTSDNAVFVVYVDGTGDEHVPLQALVKEKMAAVLVDCIFPSWLILLKSANVANYIQHSSSILPCCGRKEVQS